MRGQRGASCWVPSGWPSQTPRAPPERARSCERVTSFANLCRDENHQNPVASSPDVDVRSLLRGVVQGGIAEVGDDSTGVTVFSLCNSFPSRLRLYASPPAQVDEYTLTAGGTRTGTHLVKAGCRWKRFVRAGTSEHPHNPPTQTTSRPQNSPSSRPSSTPFSPVRFPGEIGTRRGTGGARVTEWWCGHGASSNTFLLCFFIGATFRPKRLTSCRWLSLSRPLTPPLPQIRSSARAR